MIPPLYFDHAATRWPKADGVADALAAAARNLVGNAGRSADDSAFRVIDQCRLELAWLLDVPDASRVVLTHGCTDALNLAIFGVLAHRNDRPHVVSTVLEHNSVRRPLRQLARRGIITLTEVSCDRDGFVSATDIGAACTARTVMVACSHASNVVGTIQDVAEIGRAIRTRAPGAIYLVDAAQTVGVVPVSPSAMDADLLAFGLHKSIGGPAGVGALYVGQRAFESSNPRGSLLQPVAFGGTGESGGADDDDLPMTIPSRFEVGTQNAVAAAGACAALRVLARNGSAIDHERTLVARLIAGLSPLRGVRIVGPREVDRRVGIVAIQVQAMPAAELSAALHASFAIIARAGVQCAPAAHAALGTAPDGTLRISFGPTTTLGEIDKLLIALGQIVSDDVGASSPD